eukprot:COSAG06_NODE_98_length_24155_cov_29.681784_16_plen_108_part_00
MESLTLLSVALCTTVHVSGVEAWVVLRRLRFADIVADGGYDGGAVYVAANSGSVAVVNCAFERNSVGNGVGGAISVQLDLVLSVTSRSPTAYLLVITPVSTAERLTR